MSHVSVIDAFACCGVIITLQNCTNCNPTHSPTKKLSDFAEKKRNTVVHWHWFTSAALDYSIFHQNKSPSREYL